MSLLLKKILQKIKDLENKTIIKNGERNTYYLIGTQRSSYTGSGNAGQLILFVSNMCKYQVCVPGFFTVNADGTCGKHIIGTEETPIKNIMVYTDNNKDYIFLYSPNYGDAFNVKVISNNNVTINVEKKTADEFNAYISGMTKLSQA